MAKTKKLIYKGSSGFLEGVGYVSPGDEVTLEAERAQALLKSQPKQWNDRAAPDRPSPQPSPNGGGKKGGGKKKSFREEIVEKDRGKK